MTAAPVADLAAQPVVGADAGPAGQDGNINGPVTFVHISNRGNNNSTNVNTGAGDRIVSDQEHLQSNRSDGSAPESVSGDGAPAGVADTQPTTVSGPPTTTRRSPFRPQT